MCKYCKRLKELNALDKKEYEKTIHLWRQRDYKARKLMSRLIDMYVDSKLGYEQYSIVNQADILTETYKFIHSNWIGK